MTAAQLREIGERVKLAREEWEWPSQAQKDRAELYAVVERLIGYLLHECASMDFPIGLDPQFDSTKDEAIDALLGDA